MMNSQEYCHCFQISIDIFCLHVRDSVTAFGLVLVSSISMSRILSLLSDTFSVSSVCVILGETRSFKASESNLCFGFLGKGLGLAYRGTELNQQPIQETLIHGYSR
jgi:hypothetical protein